MNIYILNTIVNGKFLSELLCKNINITGMITLDDNGIKKTNEFYNYSLFCKQRNLEHIEVESYNLSSENDRRQLDSRDIDLIIVAGWQRLVPNWLINKCTIGVIGIHGSPEGIENGRGRSPQNWALLTGYKVFFVSIFWIEEGIDDGKVIDTYEFEYTSMDTIMSSYIKVGLSVAKMIIRNIKNGRIERKEGVKQNREGYYLPQRIREDGWIDWNRDAIDISNMVKALGKPYSGAYTLYNGIEIIIWIARPIISETSDLFDCYENGCIISIMNDNVLVKCGKNLLLLDNCTNIGALEEGGVFSSADYSIQIQEIVDRHISKSNLPISKLVMDELKRNK